jgi:hypothetical protein
VDRSLICHDQLLIWSNFAGYCVFNTSSSQWVWFYFTHHVDEISTSCVCYKSGIKQTLCLPIITDITANQLYVLYWFQSSSVDPWLEDWQKRPALLSDNTRSLKLINHTDYNLNSHWIQVTNSLFIFHSGSMSHLSHREVFFLSLTQLCACLFHSAAR